MSRLKQKIVELVVRRRFAGVGARIELGQSAQLRTLAVFPAKGSSFRLGAQSIFAGRLSVDGENAFVSIGVRSYCGKSHIVAAQRIEIGDDVLISWGVTIIDHQSHSLQFDERKDDVVNWLSGSKDWSHVSIAPVHIGNKVWIGFNASVLPGVTIGEGAIVGACSVVTKDVGPWTVVAGNPARVIRRLDPSEPREKIADAAGGLC